MKSESFPSRRDVRSWYGKMDPYIIMTYHKKVLKVHKDPKTGK